MATTRNVPLTLSVETLGAEGIKRLEDDLRALAKQGGDAAPEFERLASEVERLGAQAAAATRLRDLSDAVNDLGQQELDTAERAQRLSVELEQLAIVSDRTATAERTQRDALTQAKDALFDKQQELKRLRNGMTDAEAGTDAYRAAMQKLKADIIDATAEIRQKKQALEQARVAARDAANEERALANELGNTNAAQAQAKAALAGKRQAVDEVVASMQEMGLAAKTADEAEQALTATSRQLADSIQKIRLAQDEAAAASKRAAQEDERLTLIQIANKRQLQAAAQTERDNILADYARQEQADREAAAERIRIAEFEAQRRSNIEKAAAGEYTRWWAEAINDRESQERAAQERAQRDSTEANERAAFEAKRLSNIQQNAANEYARWWTEALNKREAAEKAALDSQKQSAEAAKVTGEAIKDSLGTIGVRSVAAVKAEIDRVKAAMLELKQGGTVTGAELANAMRAGEQQVKGLEREIRELTGTLTLADRASNLFKTSMAQFAAGNLVADGVQYLIEKVRQLATEFVQANIRAESLSRGLTAIYGDSKTAASQIGFLRDVANQAGVSVGGISAAFTRFSASLNGANIPMGVANDLFKNLTIGGTTLGLSSEKISSALDALGQMAAKNVVSMEELRQQLGDALPGALTLAAKGMKLTEAELVKLVEAGDLAARDFLPAFADALREINGEVNGIQPTWDRFKNTLEQTAQAMGEAGSTQVLVGAIKALGAAVGGVALVLSGFLEIIFGITKMVGTLVGSLVTLSNPLQEMSKIVFEGTTRWSKLYDVVGQFVGVSGEAANKTTSLANAHKENAFASGLSTDATIKNFLALGRQADAMGVVAVAADKSAKARQVEAQATLAMAKVVGDATQITLAEEAAAKKIAAALQASANAHIAESTALQAALDLKVRQLEASGRSQKEIEQETEKLRNKVQVSKSETDQAVAAVAAAQQEAFARGLSIKALSDHSAETAKYKKEAEAAAITVDLLTKQFEKGAPVTAALTAAKQRLTEAQFLLRDGINDAATAQNIQNQTDLVANQISLSKVALTQSSYTAMAASARAIGDVTLATYYEVQAKEAAIAQLRIKMKIEEINIKIEKDKLELQKLKITGDNDEARSQRTLIDLQIEGLKVRQIGNKAIQDQISQLEREANAIRNGTDTRTAGGSSIDSDTDKRLRNAGAIGKQNAELEKQKRLTSDGFETNADGSAKGTFFSPLANQGLADLKFKRAGGGSIEATDLETAQGAFNQAQKAKDWLESMRVLNPGVVSTEATQSAYADLATARYILEEAQLAARRAAASSATTGSTSTVNINLNGSTTAVNVASQADADALTNLFKQLQTQAGRAA